MPDTDEDFNKFYTIATETNECYGHGDHGQELRICKEGRYGTGEFPPVFKKEEEAEEYLKGLQFSSDKCVVPITLNTPGCEKTDPE